MSCLLFLSSSLFLGTISALSSSSIILKSYSVKNSSITQYSPGGQEDSSTSDIKEVSASFWFIVIFVGTCFTFGAKMSFNIFPNVFLLTAEYLSNWVQNSPVFTLVDI